MTDKNKSKQIGDMGEDAAVRFLKRIGYAIIERNYKNQDGRVLGEIDIIANDTKNKEFVFVEVKTRNYAKYKSTLPEENITPSKLRKLEKITMAYLKNKNLIGKNYRFDAVSVWIDEKTGREEIKHLKSIFL